ncbi:ImmA/IrrE family metallo-endopeptidase [Dermacoccus abyssi]|uniref:ImmA/IrrE family metallo-endopeptidase n=2 Tax=Dermacoccus TaxID=57495 RepID=A0A417Z1G1_9MICO|nr:ImmA/IrrE family metallo-endopeptidase [Dermacoccus abyssi]
MILRRRQGTSSPQPTDLCPEDGLTDSLVANVSRRLGRQIKVVTIPLPVGLSGVWTSTEQQELIALDAASSALRRRVALCHEIAHMVLGHGTDLEGNDEPALDMLRGALPDLDPRLIRQALFRSGCILGNPDQELEAEAYATELFSHLENARRAHANLRHNRFN